MTEQEFIKQNGNIWKALEAEVKRFRKAHSRKKLTKEAIDHFVQLYNSVTTHLAYSRTQFGESETTQYLNKLAGSAHVLLYEGPKPKLKQLFQFIAFGFPTLFRKNFRPFLWATAAFVGSFLLAFLFTAQNPENGFAFTDPATLANIREEGQYDSYNTALSIYSSSAIGINNIQVSFLAFALGITLGIGTLYVMIINGLLIGVYAGYVFTKGQSLFFWSLILPHGVPELFAIFLAGGAGLMIGYALIAPGNQSRVSALVQRAVEAAKLVSGCIPILIVAALIEGFFTPLDLPYAAKYLFSGLMLILLLLYLLLPGRKTKATADQSA